MVGLPTAVPVLACCVAISLQKGPTRITTSCHRFPWGSPPLISNALSGRNAETVMRTPRAYGT